MPIAPEEGVVAEAVVAVGAHAIELADRLAPEPQSVLEPVLRARQLDQVDPVDRLRIQGDAVRRGVLAGPDHEAGVRLTPGGRRATRRSDGSGDQDRRGRQGKDEREPEDERPERPHR
jgi:hypothetical protein